MNFYQLSHVKLCHFVKIVKRHLNVNSYQWLGNIDMHMNAKCDQTNNTMWFKCYEHYHLLVTDGRTTDSHSD